MRATRMTTARSIRGGNQGPRCLAGRATRGPALPTALIFPRLGGHLCQAPPEEGAGCRERDGCPGTPSSGRQSIRPRRLELPLPDNRPLHGQLRLSPQSASTKIIRYFRGQLMPRGLPQFWRQRDASVSPICHAAATMTKPILPWAWPPQAAHSTSFRAIAQIPHSNSGPYPIAL